MSGGVDSSLTAALMQEAGYDVIGVNMRLHGSGSADDEQRFSLNKSCCSLVEMEDARRVCEQIGVPFYAMNFEKEFRAAVIDYFVYEYAQGRTPNPCLACNAYMKFVFLLRKALALGADKLATGHYARVVQDPDTGRYKLLRALDPAKDQSYVLYMLNQAQLSRTLFPLGDKHKSQTRALAAERGLVVANKAESMDICFVAGGDYREYIADKLPADAAAVGPILNTVGEVVGQHHGLPNYTIGQRKGLELTPVQTRPNGIAATKTGDKRPSYVIQLLKDKNALVVGDDAELRIREMAVEGVNIVSGIWPEQPFRAAVKIRSHAPEAPATIYPEAFDPDATKDNTGKTIPRVLGVRANRRMRIVLDEAQRAITPGQAAVLYSLNDPDEVLGGGIISATIVGG